MENHLVNLFRDILIREWEKPVFTDYGGSSYTAKEVAEEVQSLHKIYAELGIEKGQRIAFMGRNSSRWATTYISVVSYGAVAVPILPDFKEDEVLHILEHSESCLLLTSEALYEKLGKVPHVHAVYSLTDYKLLQGGENAPRYEKSTITDKTSIAYAPLPGDVLGVLSYTSGTSGFSKGVMLSSHNLYSNAKFGIDELFDEIRGNVVSFLPLAHAFGCAFEFLSPFCAGARIYFVDKIPTPTLLVKAFKEVQPSIIMMVPLIIEKIYKKKLQPVLETPKMRILLRIPVLKQFIYKKIRNQLIDTFGGKFYQMVIGGAALNPEVEAFLMKIGFPFTVGYGMTECAPLISYADWKQFKEQSCGKIVHRMEMKIDSDYPENQVGEILVKGENVMLGYHKNKEATKDVLRKDGWLRTGDLGVIDKQGLLYIRGRSKNMLLGPSGQNIYPEEIEAQVNNVPMVMESVVVDDKEHRIIALVYPDPDYCEEQGLEGEAIAEALESERKEINKNLPAYKQVHKITIVDKEFEKTPKRSIKRYLYTNLQG